MSVDSREREHSNIREISAKIDGDPRMKRVKKLIGESALAIGSGASALVPWRLAEALGVLRDVLDERAPDHLAIGIHLPTSGGHKLEDKPEHKPEYEPETERNREGDRAD